MIDGRIQKDQATGSIWIRKPIFERSDPVRKDVDYRDSMMGAGGDQSAGVVKTFTSSAGAGILFVTE